MCWNLALESYNYEDADCPANQEQGPRTRCALDLGLLLFTIWLSNSSLSLGLDLLSFDNHIIVQLSFSIS